jgi:hypothetical protein
MEGRAPRPGHVVLCRECIDRLTSRFNHCDQCFGTIDQRVSLSHFVVGYGILCDSCYHETSHQPSDDDDPA